MPLVVITTGIWHSDSLRELRALSGYVAARKGQRAPEAWSFFLANLGCGLARGNALVIAAAQRALSTASEESSADRGGGTRNSIGLDES